MANNQYVNKVVYGSNTLIDITDTTAEDNTVASGEVYYKASGERSVGTANYAKSVTFNGTKVTPDSSNDIALNESDPTVPSWAKQSSKPTYTALEVGALADPYVFDDVDLTEDDNGVDTDRIKHISVVDKNGRKIGTFVVTAYTEGPTECGLYVYNYVNGNYSPHGLTVSCDKDGTINYQVSDASPFRDSINVYSKSEIDGRIATTSEVRTYFGLT